MKKNTAVKRLIFMHLAFFCGAALAFWIFNFLGIGCVIKRLTGFPCPACGMTRAVLSLLRLDLDSYLAYNPMALFVAASVLLYFHRKPLKIPDKLANAALIIVALLTFGVYIFRLSCGLMPEDL